MQIWATYGGNPIGGAPRGGPPGGRMSLGPGPGGGMDVVGNRGGGTERGKPGGGMCVGGGCADMSGRMGAWTTGGAVVDVCTVAGEGDGVGKSGGADDVIGRRCMAKSPCWSRANCWMF